MNIRRITTAIACAAVLSVTSMSAVTAATTTVPPTATKLAPKTTKVSAPDTTVKSGKSKKPVVAGNFCKKKLVGTTSKSAAGVVLTCKADAKGQVRWTK